MGQGDTDYDGDDVVITCDATIVPASLRRLSQVDRETTTLIMLRAREIMEAQDALATLVEEAREDGISWGAIGWSLGMTGEGARLRYGASKR